MSRKARQSTPQSGYERDLRDAENAMIAAGHPAVALEMPRHSEAIRNYMQGAIVPMFVEMVERTLGPKIDGLRTDVQHWAQESATRLGKLEQGYAEVVSRLEHKRAEIDEIKRELAELKAWREAQEQSHAAAER